MSRAFFEQVIEALVGFLPPDRRGFSSRVTGRNAKVWFGAEAREHYEVQVLRRDGARALEIGFHAEHPDSARSEELRDSRSKSRERWLIQRRTQFHNTVRVSSNSDSCSLSLDLDPVSFLLDMKSSGITCPNSEIIDLRPLMRRTSGA